MDQQKAVVAKQIVNYLKTPPLPQIIHDIIHTLYTAYGLKGKI